MNPRAESQGLAPQRGAALLIMLVVLIAGGTLPVASMACALAT